MPTSINVNVILDLNLVSSLTYFKHTTVDEVNVLYKSSTCDACVSSRGAQSTELVSLYIGYWTLNNYYYYYLNDQIHACLIHFLQDFYWTFLIYLLMLLFVSFHAAFKWTAWKTYTWLRNLEKLSPCF